MNGNIYTEIYSDGTLIKEHDGNPRPEFPSSMDIKISNRCSGSSGVNSGSGSCAFCHEMSTPFGDNADLNKLQEVLSELPNVPIEFALGGGNPLENSQLSSFLDYVYARNIIANMTVNHKHIKQYQETILDYISRDRIKGLGISFNPSLPMSDITPLLSESDNIVFHLIMGVNTIEDIENLISHCSSLNKKCKILILGYKDYGFGKKYLSNYSDKVEYNSYQYYIKLAKFFKSDNLVLSFDNLAIKQLKLQRYFMKDAWDEFFMGRDGKFTMYIDAVKEEFAVSSTSVERTSWNDKSLLEFFKGVSNG
jgi:hypothetical protein